MAVASVGLAPALAHTPFKKSAESNIMTVRGVLDPSAAGVFLPHEHVISRFGEPPEEVGTYPQAQTVDEVSAYMTYLKNLGCNTVADCTAQYFGRNVDILRAIAERSGMHIITNTGIYGAASDRYVPEYAAGEKAGTLAARWIEEFENGINGSDVRPGFVKTAVDGGPLSEIDAKLVRAAAITHAETGLPLAIHTSDNLPAVKAQLAILKEEGVAPGAWMWVHAHNVQEESDLLYAAERGAWISLDGLRTPNFYENRTSNGATLYRHLEMLLYLKDRGFLNQILLSHDGSSFPPPGKDKRSFDVLFTAFIPMMRAAGLQQDEINQIIGANPARAFTIQRRKI